MRLSRLSELYGHKYKIAGSSLEQSVRSQIEMLWNVANKTHNILKACADSDVSNPATKREELAMLGYRFCKDLLSTIDAIKVYQKDIPLNILKKKLEHIIQLIIDNKKDDKFPFVNELIYVIYPISKKHDIKLRDGQLAKASTGLSRIFSISLRMLEELKEIKGDKSDPMAERFSPTRAPLSEYDIVDFIRQYGDRYGISNKDDWEIAFRDDPILREQMTTVINALNRGHNPKDDASIKMQIAEILKNHEERKSSNASLFEDAE